MTDDRATIGERAFAALLLAGLAVRILLTATSIGTNDVVFNIMWARLAEQFGVAHAYAHNANLNHPPLSLLIFHWMDRTARWIGIEYVDLFRTVQVAADAITTAALVRIGRAFGRNGRAVGLLFWLSPAAIAISAFHCNTDPTMVALVVVAALLAIRRRPGWSGCFLALATGIKILPLLVLPVFAIAIRRRRASFLTAFAAVVFLIFVPARLIGGPAVWRNIFSYSGFPGKWGITALYAIGTRIANGRPLVQIAYAYAAYGKYILGLALAALLIWLWRSRSKAEEPDVTVLTAGVPLVFLIAMFLAPGFGIQYLVWPLPLLPFLLPWRWAIAVSTAYSVYVLTAYTIWSHGFPWWYADSVGPSPGKIWVTIVGVPVWLVTGAAIAIGIGCLRRALRPAPGGAA